LPQPGHLIDCFELEEVIGVGGMGAVFRARDTDLDREVAVKLIPQGQSDDPEVVQRFYQEGRSAARLDHENIARVYSIGRDGPFHFIVFEYIAGETLRQRVEEQGPLDIADAINYTLQIAAALIHASERGVVHRDIKPSNLIVTPRGRVKLVDMGLARRFEREEDHGLTQSGMTLGTFDYISPEQARDPRDVDVRSDLYSLGCTMFHMLTGRPPFVGGTAVQKLLQHQEGMPPDVRDFNPQVSSELAGVLAKLLAKDPDRRYQTPEQLVRDLLVLGGTAPRELGDSIGLGGPELTQRPQPSWVGHLVWALPILAFVLVIGGLVWWGRELNGPLASIPLDIGPKSLPKASEAVGRTTRTSGLNEPPALDDSAETGSDSRSQAAGYPRNISVGPNEDLLAKIESAPPRSIISLSDDGPYRIGDRDKRRLVPPVLKNRDLTIRAEVGVRPVVTMAAGFAQGMEPSNALFDFVGGRITIEGIEFHVGGSGWRVPPSAIRTEETELTLRRCTFRAAVEEGRSNAPALRVRSTGAATSVGDRTPTVRADRSHFGGGNEAIQTEGPVDLVLRDCTLGSTGTPLVVDNSRSPAGTPAYIHLSHASLMTGQGPVFMVKGEARFWVDDCVIAPARRNSSTTLITIDVPHALAWQGRSNRYANISTFLAPTDPAMQSESVVDFSEWAETDMREVGSQLAENTVWKLPDPLQAIASADVNPSQAFLLAASTTDAGGPVSGVGARQGPLGILFPDDANRVDNNRKQQSQAVGGDRFTENQPLVSTTKNIREDDLQEPSGNARSIPNGEESAFLTPMAVAQGEEESPTNETGKSSSIPTATPVPTPPIPPMPTAYDVAQNPRPKRRQPETESGNRANEAVSSSAVRSGSPDSTSPKGTDAQTGAADPREIRTVREFQDGLDKPDVNGGVLRIAADADLELPSTILNGTTPWRIEQGRGRSGRRPRIRFRPDQTSLNSAPLRWSVLLTLRSGNLQFQGIDVVIPAPEDLHDVRIAAFGIGQDAELRLIDCTLTLAGNHPNLAAVVALPEVDRPRARRGGPPRRPAKLDVRDCFIRSGGDLLTLPTSPSGGIELTFVNSLLVADGSLVHARGGAMRTDVTAQRDSHAGTIRLELERVTTRTKNGLVHMESANDQPELPIANIIARDSIFCLTSPADFLFLVDGHDQPVLSLQDRITWKGHRVAYHQITKFRRDQNGITGSPPFNYNREDWAKEAKDSESFHENIRFDKWDPTQPAWSLTRDDFRLTLETSRTIGDLGPDLKIVPSPPAVVE
jgi:serine/threonine-protein kinase